MKISDFKLTAADFRTFGQGLQRPECVWVDQDGVWASDERGGIARVPEYGGPVVLGSGIAEPNGFSRRPDGSFVVAGLADGCLHLISPSGQTRTILDQIDGKPLGTVNHAWADGPDRIWVSVMTRALPWHAALSTSKVDGYILRLDEGGKRCEIVADSLDLTNEVKVSPDGRFLYAVETLGCRIVRFQIMANGSLGAKEIVGPQSLGPGSIPDGITFDSSGNLWVSMICQNGLYVIDNRGDLYVVFEDPNERAVASLAVGIERRNGTIDQLAACSFVGGPLRLPTSVAFGGPDGRTGFVGNVMMPHLTMFRIPPELE